jgi:hypothetical protein
VSHHMRDCKTRLCYRLNDAPAESGYIRFKEVNH